MVRAGLVGRLLGGPVATAVLLERRGSEEKKLDDDRGERQTIYIYITGGGPQQGWGEDACCQRGNWGVLPAIPVFGPSVKQMISLSVYMHYAVLISSYISSTTKMHLYPWATLQGPGKPTSSV